MNFISAKNAVQPQVWDKMFSDILLNEMSNAKKMVYDCVNLSDCFAKETGVLKEMTFGQCCETIIFFKMVHYHLLNTSQIEHNLFYCFMYELYKKHYKESEQDSIVAINIIKSSEKWYIESYLNEEDKDFRMPGIMSRFYNSLKRLSNPDKPNTQVSVSRDEFSQRVGAYIERFHMQQLNKFLTDIKE